MAAIDIVASISADSSAAAGLVAAWSLSAVPAAGATLLGVAGQSILVTSSLTANSAATSSLKLTAGVTAGLAATSSVTSDGTTDDTMGAGLQGSSSVTADLRKASAMTVQCAGDASLGVTNEGVIVTPAPIQPVMPPIPSSSIAVVGNQLRAVQPPPSAPKYSVSTTRRRDQR